MSLSDLFQNVDEKSDFLRIAEELLAASNIEMKTIISKPMLLSVAFVYRQFLKSAKCDSSLIDTLLDFYFRLSVSKKGISREQIVEILKSSTTPENRQNISSAR